MQRPRYRPLWTTTFGLLVMALVSCRSPTPAEAPHTASTQGEADATSEQDRPWLPAEQSPAPVATVEPSVVCAHLIAMGERANTPQATDGCNASMGHQAQERGSDAWNAYAECILRGRTPAALRQCDVDYRYDGDAESISTGIAECDELYRRMLCALDSMGDQSTKMQARQAFVEAAEAWREMGSDPATRKAATEACMQAVAASRETWESAGC